MENQISRRILKLFGSRFASDLRQHHEVPDLTPVIAAAAGYRAFFQQESKTFEEWDAKRIELHRSNERGRSNCSCCTSRGPGVIVVPVPIPYVVYLQIIISRKRKRKKNIPGLETHPSLAPVVIGAAAIAVGVVAIVICGGGWCWWSCWRVVDRRWSIVDRWCTLMSQMTHIMMLLLLVPNLSLTFVVLTIVQTFKPSL